jgi:uridine kinase
MTERKINISITGLRGSGKTTIANAIKYFLTHYCNSEVNVNDDAYKFSDWYKRFEASMDLDIVQGTKNTMFLPNKINIKVHESLTFKEKVDRCLREVK